MLSIGKQYDYTPQILDLKEYHHAYLIGPQETKQRYSAGIPLDKANYNFFLDTYKQTLTIDCIHFCTTEEYLPLFTPKQLTPYLPSRLE